MKNDLMYANDNIKLLLKYRNWTQNTLCEKTGMTLVTLQRRLNCKVPKWTMLEASSISKAFGMTVDEIFFTRMIPKCNSERRTS